ncbi:hypothetical protein HMPREF0742_00394 [Rothia aeria F0184]|uniref:Uncharacterized protein n=1 Tax=Rothia aeria F0184 TaxID=888019 RepID=U7V8L8_9MICC|nr:hypothetical protein HMPREF0742_00394 [Rothia aeria F0184]
MRTPFIGGAQEHIARTNIYGCSQPCGAGANTPAPLRINTLKG